MRQRAIAYQLLIPVAFVLAVSGCSVEKNTGASRFYNSLISKYNIWFNGNEAFKSGVARLNSSYRDDYSSIIPVFEYTAPEAPSIVSSDMERAVQKASKVISLYSITAKPEEKGNRNSGNEEFYNRKEYNDWVDDSYLLLAKAQFYQYKFKEARAALSFAIGISTSSDIIAEATIWQARIQTEQGVYSEALRILQGMTGLEEFPRTLRSMYFTTLADVYLRQKRYNEAVAPLTEAVSCTSQRNTRIRLTYLLAQTCEAAGENALSTRYFTEVIRMNPPYEMEFNAGINLAGVADISEKNATELKRSLQKMLRDSKNKDYLDQIYYALGELGLRQGNTGEALRLWQQAASASTINNRQKAKAFIALGAHYYTVPDYMKAYLYYDSASYLINNRFPDFDNINNRTTALKEYAGFHSVVVKEDSLRRVADMSTSERDALISGLIRSYEEKMAGDRKSDGADRYNMGQYYENEQRSQNAISAEGAWYFYNQAALTFGRTEFRRRWGDRRLEDNWRRSNKTRNAFTAATPAAENGNEKPGNDSASVSPERTKEFYLRELPLNDSLMQISFNLSARALLGEGKLLYSRLNDTVRAANALEEASRTGDDDQAKAEALYELYRLLRISDPARAERRRAELLQEYPESEYTLILIDPDFVKHQQQLSARLSGLYDSAWVAFNSEKYIETRKICDSAMEHYPGGDLIPKFMLLDALATGATEGEIAYKSKLDSLIARFPGTPEGQRAAEITTVLKREIPAIQVAEDRQIADRLYTADTLQPHYVMIIAENKTANLNRIVFDIINYNLDNYPDKNYRTEGAVMDNVIMITIGQFGGAAAAGKWLSSFQPMEVIRDAASAGLSLYLISRDNLPKFRQDGNISRYRIFYQENYPGTEKATGK